MMILLWCAQTRTLSKSRSTIRCQKFVCSHSLTLRTQKSLNNFANWLSSNGKISIHSRSQINFLKNFYTVWFRTTYRKMKGFSHKYLGLESFLKKYCNFFKKICELQYKFQQCYILKKIAKIRRLHLQLYLQLLATISATTNATLKFFVKNYI